ncbi:MAG: hypothetical protein ACPG49_14155, partial [Chitinophagales bacterium]
VDNQTGKQVFYSTWITDIFLTFSILLRELSLLQKSSLYSSFSLKLQILDNERVEQGIYIPKKLNQANFQRTFLFNRKIQILLKTNYLSPVHHYPN